jgi:hypothetical protein
MTRRDALRALLEQVEAGKWKPPYGVYPAPLDGNAWDAYRGSLDAAKALHEATLPGWWWSIGTCNVSDDARVSPHDDRRAPDGGEWAEWTDVDLRPSGNPARAWLIAIIRALIEEAGE